MMPWYHFSDTLKGNLRGNENNAIACDKMSVKRKPNSGGPHSPLTNNISDFRLMVYGHCQNFMIPANIQDLQLTLTSSSSSSSSTV